MRLNTLTEERVLVLAPRGRDASVVQQVLAASGFPSLVCADQQALVRALEEGAGAALVAEEALLGCDLTPLAEWLARQASWSDFPFVMLVSRQSEPRTAPARALLEGLSNVILLERPLNAETLRRAAASALRARKRQYQARSDLQARIHGEERLRIALQAGGLGAWELELATSALHMSAASKGHYGRDPAQPFTFAQLLSCIHPDDMTRRRGVIDNAVAAGADFSIEYRVIWPDSSIHWVHVQGKTIADESGKPMLIAGVSQDVTSRRESERRLQESQEALRQLNETLELRIEERTAELAQANDRLMREITERERTQVALVQAQKMEAIGRLTGGIAHDFNNLLNVILGNVDLIDRLSTDERIKRMAATARKSSQRGAKLTSQLLAFARSQSLNLQPVNLVDVMESTRDLLSASLGSDVSIVFEIAPGMPPVKADLNQIELAILNLAINSRDAMPDGGTVTIRSEMRSAPPDLLKPGHYGVISVRDNGAGINPEIITKVFDPFFTTKALGKGTGLGLSQVYGIAKQSGGTARIESTVGVGTTVEIWLPLAERASALDGYPGPAAKLDHQNRGAKILVVEDDPGVRQFIVECLEMSGYHVTQADDGQAGLDQLDVNTPDLMIVDFLMPGMNGAELAAQANKKCPRLPIIFATGYADMKAIEQVIGRNSVLRKPFQMNELVASVRMALTQ
jgi:signal transduction histidine kinase/DNA-binding response OmpR family regulator